MCTTELGRLDFFSLEITVAISTIAGKKDFFNSGRVTLLTAYRAYS